MRSRALRRLFAAVALVSAAGLGAVGQSGLAWAGQADPGLRFVAHRRCDR